ncbi:MAG: hypothetical protein HRU22_07510 [Gammaproteobacteria bacterium]|nr:hypothetical protein [Gammaproteobacteria bacterium]
MFTLIHWDYYLKMATLLSSVHLVSYTRNITYSAVLFKEVSIENHPVVILQGFDFKQSTGANYGKKSNDAKTLLKLKARKDCLFCCLRGNLALTNK